MNRTDGEVVAEVILLRAVSKDYSFLIVEGCDDVKFWKLRVHENCRIINAYCKSIGIGSVRKLNSRAFDGHVGVFDRDYDDAQSASNCHINIIFWDGYSIESILFYSNATKRVIVEKIDNVPLNRLEKTIGSTLCDHVERICVVVGQMRYLHAMSHISKNKDDLTPYRFVQKGTNMYLDVQALHDRAVELGVVPSKVQIASYIRSIPKLHNRYIARGHDLTAMLSLAFGDHGESCGAKNVEEHLRLAYERGDLENTTVFGELRVWEAKRAPFRILV